MSQLNKPKVGYHPPGVSITVQFKKTPDGYIKDIPIRGTVSSRKLDSAVTRVISARPGTAQGTTYKISIPKALIAKGYKVGLIPPELQTTTAFRQKAGK